MRIFTELWRQKNFMFKLGVVICVTWILVAILAPVISPYSPTEVVMEDRFQSPKKTPTTKEISTVIRPQVMDTRLP